MCHCPVCQDSARFQSELIKLPAERQGVFRDLYDNLLEKEMDVEYHRAVLDGSWPAADEIIAKFHGQPASAARLTLVPQQGAPALHEEVSTLPAESQSYFGELVQRVLATATELAAVRNIVRNAVPEASAALAQHRAKL
jgi:hypothetical protein